MSKLNQRLAKEARKMAMECVESTAPEFGIGSLDRYGVPCCALGHLGYRVTGDAQEMLSSKYCGVSGLLFIVERANDYACDHADRDSRLVFPLLALADELEALP